MATVAHPCEYLETYQNVYFKWVNYIIYTLSVLRKKKQSLQMILLVPVFTWILSDFLSYKTYIKPLFYSTIKGIKPNQSQNNATELYTLYLITQISKHFFSEALR